MKLAIAFRAPEVDGGPDRDRTEIERLADRGEDHLVVRIRVMQEIVVIQLHQERDLVRVAAGDCAEGPERRGEGRAIGFDRELAEVRRVEVSRVLRKAGSG